MIFCGSNLESKGAGIRFRTLLFHLTALFCVPCPCSCPSLPLLVSAAKAFCISFDRAVCSCCIRLIIACIGVLISQCWPECGPWGSSSWFIIPPDRFRLRCAERQCRSTDHSSYTAMLLQQQQQRQGALDRSGLPRQQQPSQQQCSSSPCFSWQHPCCGRVSTLLPWLGIVSARCCPTHPMWTSR